MYLWLSVFIPHSLWACTRLFNAMHILWVVSQWSKVKVLSLWMLCFVLFVLHSLLRPWNKVRTPKFWHSVGHRGGLKWQPGDWQRCRCLMWMMSPNRVLFFVCEATHQRWLVNLRLANLSHWKNWASTRPLQECYAPFHTLGAMLRRLCKELVKKKKKKKRCTARSDKCQT